MIQSSCSQHNCRTPVLFSDLARRLTLDVKSIWRNSISLANYIKQLSKFVLSSAVVLGLIVGGSLLIAGETTMEVDLTFEFGPFDGLWWIVGLPVLSILVLVILSPLSFLVYRLLSRKRTEEVRSDS